MNFKILAIFLFSLFLVSCDSGLSSDIRAKTITADKAIENYEWFKQQEQDIKSKYAQEERAKQSAQRYKEMLPESYEKWTRGDKSEFERLNSIVDGLGYQVDQMVADYNARITMKHREIFKDSLPTNIVRGVNTLLEFKYDEPIYKPNNN